MIYRQSNIGYPMDNDRIFDFLYFNIENIQGMTPNLNLFIISCFDQSKMGNVFLV